MLSVDVGAVVALNGKRSTIQWVPNRGVCSIGDKSHGQDTTFINILPAIHWGFTDFRRNSWHQIRVEHIEPRTMSGVCKKIGSPFKHMATPKPILSISLDGPPPQAKVRKV